MPIFDGAATCAIIDGCRPYETVMARGTPSKLLLMVKVSLKLLLDAEGKVPIRERAGLGSNWRCMV